MDTERETKRKQIRNTKEREVGQKGKRERRRKAWRRERRMMRMQDNTLLTSTPAETFISTAFYQKVHGTYECKMCIVVNAVQYRTFVYMLTPKSKHKVSP
ncbi:hypothetical protein ILYODFUR_019613 [Ilyodon furcidens]|uniref:Uncharacterized protein n=1 Tax=Ilyodon furcidens TaxID=33524 RepID=A0ABV0SYF0_9TELE